MPRNPASNDPVLSVRALNRATLARQSLICRSEATPLAMVQHLIGMQAQAPFPPYFGLWSRLEHFAPDDLSRLLLDRRVVRIVVMRGTVHLVTAGDAAILRALTQPIMNRVLRQNSQFRNGVEGVDLDALAARGRALVEEQPRSMAQLRPLLAAHWPEHDPAALSHAVYYLLPLVQIPPRGVWGKSGQPVCTTLDTWTGAPLPAAPSIDEIVLRYLAAFGPATVRDMQTWIGLTRLADVFERLRPQFVTFRNEEGRELFDLPDAPRPDAETPAPARILAAFDNVLIGYADRRRMMRENHQQQIFTQNGIIQSTVLVDGFSAGLTSLKREQDRATLTVKLFHAISKRDRDEIAAEGERLLAFAEPDAGSREIVFTGAE